MLLNDQEMLIYIKLIPNFFQTKKLIKKKIVEKTYSILKNVVVSF